MRHTGSQLPNQGSKQHPLHWETVSIPGLPGKCLTGCLLFSCLSVFVQSLSHVQLFATPWTAARQASVSFTISQSLPKLISTELVMLSNHLILCQPFVFLPSIFPSIRVFSNEKALHIRWLQLQLQHQSF